MQIILYTNGKQVVSNDADAYTTAENVKNELGEGSRSVPMGTAMFMIYAEGDNGVEVSAIVSELTFSSKPSGSPRKVEETAEPETKQESPADTVKIPVKTEEKTASVPAAPQKTVPVAKPLAKPVAKPTPRPAARNVSNTYAQKPTVQKAVAKPSTPAAKPVQTAKPTESVPKTEPAKQTAQTETVSRPIRQRHYSV